MSNRTLLTAAQIAEICRLREDEDLSYGRIAQVVGCSENQVRWHCREQGAYGPRDVLEFRKRGPARPITRGGRPVIPFSAAEDAVLLLHIASPNYSAIGRSLGRNPGSVRTRFHTIARQQALSEEA